MNKPYFRVLACWLCWALVPLSALSEPAPAPSPKAAPVSGKLRVAVFSSLGRPVSGARVSVFALRGPGGEELSPCGGYVEVELEAVSETRFEKDFPPNLFRVEASAEGWIGQVLKEVELKAGEVRELEIKLEPGQTIAGRVEDEEGIPLAGVELTYSSSGMESGPFLYSAVRKAVSDSDGRFDLKGLKEGVYWIDASRAGYVEERMREVATGTDNLRICLRKGAVIKGSLRGELETLPRAVSLEFKSGRRTRRHKVDLGAENTFCVSNLEKGVYSIRVSDGDYISDWVADVSAGPEGEAEEVLLTVRRGAGISGRVVAAGTKLPLKGILVQLSPVGSTASEFDSTDEEGKYEFQGLPAGSYRLSARLWYDSYETKRGEREITLASGEKLPGVRLELDPGRLVTVSGLVVDDEGKPVPAAEVREYCRLPGQEQFQLNYRGKIVSEETGAFSTEILVPEEAEIKLAADKKGFAPSPGELIPLAAGGNSVEGIFLQLSPGGDLFVGVEDEEGRALVGAVVSLRTDWSTRREQINFSSRKKLSDSRGGCLFENLPAVDFRIQLKKDGYCPASEKITLPAGGASERITVKMQAGRDLQVTVKNTRGDAVEGAAVSFQEAGRGRGATSFTSRGNRTDARGLVVLRDLPPRSGLVSAEAEGYSDSPRRPVAADQAELEVVLNDAGSIRGRFLTAAGHPVPEVRIRGRQRDAEPFDFESIFGYGSRTVELGEGSFRFRGFVPGNYDLTVNSPGLATKKISGVKVAPARETDLGEIVLRPEGTIAGSVVESLTGSPLDKFRVRVEGGDFMENLFNPRAADEPGGYILRGLEAGEYTLIVSAPDFKRKKVPGIILATGEEKRIPRIELDPLTPEEREELARRRRVIPSLGVRIENTEEPDQDLTIAEVLPGSAAAAAGLRSGDEIRKINGKTRAEDPKGFMAVLLGQPGTKAMITVARGGTEEEIEIELGPWDFQEYLEQMWD